MACLEIVAVDKRMVPEDEESQSSVKMDLGSNGADDEASKTEPEEGELGECRGD